MFYLPAVCVRIKYRFGEGSVSQCVKPSNTNMSGGVFLKRLYGSNYSRVKNSRTNCLSNEIFMVISKNIFKNYKWVFEYMSKQCENVGYM
jgi:hypothetical protein